LNHYREWLDDCLETFDPKNTFACANCGVTQFAASKHDGGNFVKRPYDFFNPNNPAPAMEAYPHLREVGAS